MQIFLVYILDQNVSYAVGSSAGLQQEGPRFAWSMHVLPVHVWFPFGYPCFLPQLKK